MALIAVGLGGLFLAEAAMAADYVNTDPISTTAGSTHGIEFLESGSTLTNSGAISTGGISSYGIYADGASNTLTNSGTITTEGNMSHGIDVGGDSNTLTNSGTITMSGASARGIQVIGSWNKVINSGAITMSNATSHGIYVLGGWIEVINSGVITTSNIEGHGIYVFGSSNTLTNSGTITMEGNASHGIYADGNSNTLTNSGTITTSNNGSHGIYANGASNTLTNSGTITTSNSGSYGIGAGGASSTLTNSGTITTFNSGSHGIYVGGASSTLTNSGTITTSEYQAHGIEVSGNSSTVINSGAITTTGNDSYAIHFSDVASGNRLSLLSGTALSGATADLYLGSGTDVTVDMDSSAVWSYAGTLGTLAGQGTTLVSSTSDTITVASASGEAVSSSVEAARGMAISGMLARVAQQAAAPSVRVASAGNVDMPAPPKWTAWSMGYGEKTQRNSSDGAPFSAAMWGGAVGLDRHLDNGLAVGAFVGGDKTRIWLNRRDRRVVEKTRYLGLRAGVDDNDGVFWSAAAFGGLGDVTSRRNTAGSELSTYDTDTLFGGMTGVAGYHQILGRGYGVTYRGRVNYDARHTDGYTETIGGVDMDVADRLSQSVGGRADVGLDFWGAERRWQVSPRIGVEGWRAVGDESTDIRFGSSAHHVADDTSSSVGVVTGLDATYRFDNGFSVSAMAEGRRDRDGTTATLGAIQASFSF